MRNCTNNTVGAVARLARLALFIGVLAVVSCGGEPDSPDQDTGPLSDASSAQKDVSGVNNWAQGYSMELTFFGGPADGRKLILNRDLFGVSTAFSFGSVHYSQGEVAFAMTDTMQVDVSGVQSQVEIILNFGLVVGSSVNPVNTAKVGVYPFSCRPPMVRIFFKNYWFRSTCAGLKGEFNLTDYANIEGGNMAGTFSGRLQAHFPDASFPDDCKAEDVAKTCKRPEWYAEVKGVFGFTLPAKDGK